MVEVGGFIHQLDVGKADEERDDGNTIFIAQSNKPTSILQKYIPGNYNL